MDEQMTGAGNSKYKLLTYYKTPTAHKCKGSVDLSTVQKVLPGLDSSNTHIRGVNFSKNNKALQKQKDSEKQIQSNKGKRTEKEEEEDEDSGNNNSIHSHSHLLQGLFYLRLVTPNRTWSLGFESAADLRKWITVFNQVLMTNMTAHVCPRAFEWFLTEEEKSAFEASSIFPPPPPPGSTTKHYYYNGSGSGSGSHSGKDNKHSSLFTNAAYNYDQQESNHDNHDTESSITMTHTDIDTESETRYD